MQWSVPRELLWAVIFGLAITIVALWPSYYPYSQAPNIDAKYLVSGEHPAEHAGPAPINVAGGPDSQYGRENASEVTILGIRPGEWLLGIVTWMLWLATARLVKGADKTAERQLRAYVHIIRGAIQPHEQPNGIPTITAQVTLKNTGQTPAYEHRTWIGIRVEEPETFTFEFPESMADRASSIIGPSIESDMTIGFVIGQENLQAVLDGRKRLFVWGIVEYRDAFNHKRFLRFRAANGSWSGDRWSIGPYGEGYQAD